MTTDRETTYDVRIWKTDKYVGSGVTTYRVRWVVAGVPLRRGHRSAAAAESFRSKLTTALREGHAFDVKTGLPVSMVRREARVTTWYDFACEYMDMKWPQASPKHRKAIAEALVVVTPALLTRQMEAKQAKAVRSALLNWGLNSARRGSDEQPEEVTQLLEWVARCSRPLADIADSIVVRAALELAATRISGGRTAGRTAALRRSILSTALEYAVERKLLKTNPVRAIKRPTTSRSLQAVDRRAVVNVVQAQALLAQVKVTSRSGPRLVAFFATMYYAALRPEEAANLRLANLDLPESGQAWLILERAAPEIDKHWTDSGNRREERELKHRSDRDIRRVPCPPELAELLRHHLATYGVGPTGLIFTGERGSALAGSTYNRAWANARQTVLTPEQCASPLARRPYDLRHACVSTWLNSGVGPARVAEWAGHSIDVLLRIYAKCIDGQEEEDLRKINQTSVAGPATSIPLDGTAGHEERGEAR